MTDVQKLLNFAKGLAINYGCECRPGGYDIACRRCSARDVIKEVLGDKADSLIDGPYYGTSKELVAFLVEMGQPTDHLPEEQKCQSTT
jgi:hypothetical protein